MMNEIYQIEIDVTNKCNASCPQCVRNYYGSYTWPSLPIVDIDIELLINGVSLSTWKNLKHVRLCGTYGDPCMHSKLQDIVKAIKKLTDASITINTNGGIRSKKWWADTAKILDSTKDTVVFGLDGLADTNHLYRKGVNFHKAIANIKAFNKSGGRSIWQFLVFKHNQHQVQEAKELAFSIGCADFAVKKTSRFLDKTHNLTDSTPVLDSQGHAVYYLEPPTDEKYINQGYEIVKQTIKFYGSYQKYLANTKIECFAKRMYYVNITATGEVFPCAWLADRMYGFESESHVDHGTLLKIMESIGGRDQINLRNVCLEDIVNGPWFAAIEQSWATNSIERCANQCGERSNLVAHANAGQFKSLMEIK